MTDHSFTGPTRMRCEINETPPALHRLLNNSHDSIVNAARDIRRLDPRFVTTVARGSSDHAATYVKYVAEILAGVPVASIGPSIASIYRASLRFERAVNLSISQSGRSPDIVQMTQSAIKGGALGIAIVNNAQSPLADACHHVIDIQAGPEKSVAATKTFVSSIVAGLLILACWRKDEKLLTALRQLPDCVEQAINCDWTPLCEALIKTSSLFVLGRGANKAIADEAALKLKETCQLHAESYSSAEVMHGPAAIIGPHFPILAFASRDAARASVINVASRMAHRGANVFLACETDSDVEASGVKTLPVVSSSHPIVDAVTLIASFYSFVEKLAKKRNLDPDAPPNLQKVTETL